ncbi:MAG: hypothetical protein ACTTKF_06385 [Bacteroides sp.]
MADEKRTERSYELRSEKVRSIVGQMPSSLVRYGITVIGGVLLCLFVVAYFLPYKQVYLGTATLPPIAPQPQVDSVEVTLLLRFENKRPAQATGQHIYLQASKCAFEGEITSFSMSRDTLYRQRVKCRFNAAEIQSVENQTVDFRMVYTSGNLLGRLLGGCGAE